MSPPLPGDLDDVETLAAAVLGVEPVAVSRVPSFAGNRVFRVSRPSRQRAVFFKFGSSADIAREHHALVLAADSGVPVPEVEATDIDGRFSPYPRIAGSDQDVPSSVELGTSSTSPSLSGEQHLALPEEERPFVPLVLGANDASMQPHLGRGTGCCTTLYLPVRSWHVNDVGQPGTSGATRDP